MTADVGLFDEVVDVVIGLVPRDLGRPRARARRFGIKVWFGAETPPKEHYEAQVIGPDVVDDAATLALEVGFHAEHPRVAENDAVITRLLDDERRWRRVLGAEPMVGPFLGHPDSWRRISEAWPDPDLSDAGLALEVGARLTDYISALEPLRRQT